MSDIEMDLEYVRKYDELPSGYKFENVMNQASDFILKMGNEWTLEVITEFDNLNLFILSEDIHYFSYYKSNLFDTSTGYPFDASTDTDEKFKEKLIRVSLMFETYPGGTLPMLIVECPHC